MSQTNFFDIAKKPQFGGRMLSFPTVKRKPAGNFLPPSGREGDHEVVEGARGHKSAEEGIVAGGYGILPCGER